MYSFRDDIAEPGVLLAGIPTVGDGHYIRIDQENGHLVSEEAFELVKAVSPPHTVSEARAIAARMEFPPEVIDGMVDSDLLIRFESGHPDDLMHALSGYRLFAEGHQVPYPLGRNHIDGVTFITILGSLGIAIPISWTLAVALWHREPDEDFPATVRRHAFEIGADPLEVAHEASLWLPGLLTMKYGFFAPLGS